MTLEPYRAPAPPPAEAPAETPPRDEKARLGVLRSVHRPGPLWRSIGPGIGVALVVMVAGAAMDRHVETLSITGSFALIVLFVLAWGPWRRRDVRVELHAHGVVVHARSQRDVVVFEDVDALFWDLDVLSVSGKRHARIEAIRLVDHDGVTHRVPMLVDEPVTLAQWIQRHCSDHLLADAQAAIRAGETLTFGSVRIDRDGICFGERATSRWKDIRLALLQSGRICLFRRMPIFPWRRIAMQTIPHPTVFTRLVQDLAPRVEIEQLIEGGR